METNYRLPKDLNESLKNMEDAIIQSLLDSIKRFTIEFNFEGLKFNRIGITIYKILSKNNNVFITFADQGAVALAQRDYPDIKDKIFTFKSFNESNNINNIDSAMISILPQPYDFDSLAITGYMFLLITSIKDDLPEPFGPINITFSEYAIFKFKSLITLKPFLKQFIFFASNQNLLNTKTYYSKI